MSRIYFHTPTETVEVYGTERAHMGVLCSNVAYSVFSLFDEEQKRALLPPDHHLRAVRDPRQFETFFETLLAVAYGEILTTKLNTVLAIGNDPLCLAARLQGQCELHAYVMPEDAEWLAGIFEEGLGCGVFREGFPDRPSGWRDVIALLRRTEDPVVTSYSVSEGFPNSGVAYWEPPVCRACGGSGKPNPQMKHTDVSYDYCTSCEGEGKLWESWYDLSDAERWRLAMKGLTGQERPPRLDPNNWPWFFGDGKTAFDYLRPTESVRQ